MPSYLSPGVLGFGIGAILFATFGLFAMWFIHLPVSFGEVTISRVCAELWAVLPGL